MTTSRKIIVAGASGLVGQAAYRHFAARPGWEAIGVARRIPKRLAELPGGQLYPLDLADTDACAALLAEIGSEVTDLVFTAQYEPIGLASGWFDKDAIELNRKMLVNFFEPLLAHAKGLKHVTLMQGSKAYGMHVPDLYPRIRIPLREREPRVDHPNFYFVQQDYLFDRQKGADWGLTVFRPTVVYGDAEHANMNAIRPIAVYAALEREKGLVLDYPGQSYEQSQQEAIDSDLVAEALEWAATSPNANGQEFNLTNGDMFTWRHSWGAVARAFGMQPGEHRPMSFQADLPKRDAEWAAIVDKYNLDAPRTIMEHVGHNALLYGDWMTAGTRPGRSAVSPYNSIIKVRQAGFQGCMDTEDMLYKWFRRMQEWGVVPDYRSEDVKTYDAEPGTPGIL